MLPFVRESAGSWSAISTRFSLTVMFGALFLFGSNIFGETELTALDKHMKQ